MSKKVAIVTGGNKGIGLEIVKGLCRRFEGVVYLTARDEERGNHAVSELKKIGLNPEFHKLDVTERGSIAAFADYIEKKHGGIDIIVNNAAILNFENLYPSYEEAKSIIDTNYRSVLTVSELFYPLLRDNARVINISSDCGHLSNIRKTEWIDLLSSKDVTIADVNKFVDSYLESVKNGTLNKEDYADHAKQMAYRVSKIALTVATFIHQRELNHRGISVNAVHPGFVQTDMTRGLGNFTQEEGASAPLYLALDAPSSLKGTYMWYDKNLVNWYDAGSDHYCKWGL